MKDLNTGRAHFDQCRPKMLRVSPTCVCPHLALHRAYNSVFISALVTLSDQYLMESKR
jgi:hypothetical protein